MPNSAVRRFTPHVHVLTAQFANEAVVQRMPSTATYSVNRQALN
jgi:hypothetical protein